jgi:predicted aspartyl protease
MKQKACDAGVVGDSCKLSSMRAGTAISCLMAVSVTGGPSQVVSDLKPLYEAHRWIELNNKLQNTDGMPFYRGAVAVTFNQDSLIAEKMLLSVIRSAPHSNEAYKAYEWLNHLYFYRGQYRSLISIMERKWAEFPDGSDRLQEQTAMVGFRGLPNQILEKIQPSTLTHESGSIFIPFSINGRPAEYFFDTGAWVSCMSESEAKRLGLSVRQASGTVGTSAGADIGFRTAIAQSVVVGKIRFKNVSFAVFPDSQEPWSVLPPGRRGILGIPILVGVRTLRWNRATTIEIGNKSEPLDIRRSNLAFDNDHVVVTAKVEQREIRATLDTGAETTDLYKPFADEFARLLSEKGKKDSTEVRGVGHAETFDSVTLPELRIQLGGSDTVLKPAHVLLRSIGATCCVGNIGMDLLQQSPAFRIDFGAMTLQLEPAKALN